MSIFKNILYNFKKNILKYAPAFLLLAVLGFALGVFVFLSGELSVNDINEDMNGDERVNYLIREYEKSEPVDLVVSPRAMSGNRNAPVEVVMVHDFTCPHCINAGRLFERMNKEYYDLFKIYYIPIPVSGMCEDFSEDEKKLFGGACIAATAAVCAIDQKKFRVMYDNLYSDYSGGLKFSRESVSSIAEKNHFNMDRFNKCFDSREAGRLVRANLVQSEKAGVTAVPAVFVDGRRMSSIINDEMVLRGFFEYLKLRRGR